MSNGLPPAPDPRSPLGSSRWNGQVYTSHYQFFLSDRNPQWEDVVRLWTEPGTMLNRVAVGKGIVLVGAAGYGFKPIELELLSEPPLADDYQQWDHVTEASIDLPSGELYLTEPEGLMGKSLPLAIKSGTYRLRIYYGDVASAFRDFGPWLGPLDEGGDHYLVRLWPSSNQSLPLVLKRWEGWGRIFGGTP